MGNFDDRLVINLSRD